MRDEPAAGLSAPGLGGLMDKAGAEPRICPFLRAANDDGPLGDPIRRPDEANLCTALGNAAPQSFRQQESACLSSAHVNCPRFWRGSLAMVDAAPTRVGSRLQLTPAIVGALLVLAASFALSVGFVVANGGMDLPAAATGGPQGAVGSANPNPGGSPDAGATAVAPATASADTTPSPESSLAATPVPTATPTVRATPRPSSDRYALLEPCPDAQDCWIYLTRTGDNLVSIAHYFGVPLEVVTDLNPWTKTTKLVAGKELRLPPPTR